MFISKLYQLKKSVPVCGVTEDELKATHIGYTYFGPALWAPELKIALFSRAAGMRTKEITMKGTLEESAWEIENELQRVTLRFTEASNGLLIADLPHITDSTLAEETEVGMRESISEEETALSQKNEETPANIPREVILTAATNNQGGKNPSEERSTGSSRNDPQELRAHEKGEHVEAASEQ